jgi:hypothetical protein
MDLAIRPEDLYAASVALSACSSRLDDAALTFARSAQADVPEIGVKAAEAVGHGVIAAEHAIQVISTDIDKLAHALAALAQFYPRVDAAAVSRQ